MASFKVCVCVCVCPLVVSSGTLWFSFFLMEINRNQMCSRSFSYRQSNQKLSSPYLKKLGDGDDGRVGADPGHERLSSFCLPWSPRNADCIYIHSAVPKRLQGHRNPEAQLLCLMSTGGSYRFGQSGVAMAWAECVCTLCRFYTDSPHWRLLLLQTVMFDWSHGILLVRHLWMHALKHLELLEDCLAPGCVPLVLPLMLPVDWWTVPSALQKGCTKM